MLLIKLLQGLPKYFLDNFIWLSMRLFALLMLLGCVSATTVFDVQNMIFDDFKIPRGGRRASMMAEIRDVARNVH